MSDEDVQIKFGAALEGVNLGITQMRELLQGLEEPIRGVRENLGELAEGFIAAFAVEKISEFIEKMAELGEQVGRTAEQLGLTTEEVTKLDYAATISGSSAEGMRSLLERLSNTMEQAARGSKVQIDAFHQLGIEYKDAQGNLRPLNDMLGDLAERFKDAPDGPQKTAIAIALLGRSGADLIPMLNLGREGLQELGDEAQRAGVVMDEASQKGFAQVAEKVNTMKESWTGLWETIFKQFEPAFNSILDQLTQWIQGVNAAVSNDNLLHAGMQDLLFVIDSIIAGIEALIAAFSALWVMASAIITQLGQGLTALSTGMVDALSGNFGKAQADLQNGWNNVIATNVDATAKVKQILADYTKDTDELFGVGSHQPLVTNDHKRPIGAPTDSAGATDAADAARAKLDGEIKVAQEGLARKQLILNDELKMKQISEAGWVKASEDAVNAEYSTELGLLQKELQINGLKLAQRQEILNKIQELEQKHATEITKIQQKAAADALASWKGVTDASGNAVSSQVSALLKGTETFGDAMKNIGLDLATQVIENAIKSIAASAAQAFAGTFGFLAPIMGPAAAGPAAASEATVMAAAGGLASLDVGTWGLPSDGPIMAHRGETIIPAFESGQFREAMANMSSGGGSGDVHLHVHAIDAAGVADFFRQHGSTLAKEVAGQFNANRSLRPSF